MNSSPNDFSGYLQQIGRSIPSTIFNFPLSSKVAAEVRLTGGAITAEHLIMLKGFLSLSIRALQKEDRIDGHE